MPDFKKVNEEIAEGVTGSFQKIEDGVVGGYKKIEGAVVGAYKQVEDPLYIRITKKQREKLAPEIMRLADELME